MESTTGSLASHFPTRRRIFGTPGTDSDALVKQAQSELKLAAEEAKKTVFRFDFDLSGELQDVPKKKKNKKKKKKSKAKSAAVEAVAVEGGGVAGAPMEPVTAPKTSPKAASIPAAKPTVTPPATKTATATKAATAKKKDKTSASSASKEMSPPAEAAGFMKLRKPTSSDSEVMKMQLRYGRGKRNLAAIAQREKKKKEQQENGEVASDSVGSGFQFNFFS